MAVCQLEHVITIDELLEWQEFYKLENEDTKKAMAEAKSRRGR